MSSIKPTQPIGPMSKPTGMMSKPILPKGRALKKAIKPQLSQRDSYANAMNRATRAGGSNGVGVGY
jgi:hypothetical protein